MGLGIQTLWDPFHRAWNDLKNSLKQSKGKLYKVLLQYSLVFNLGYGPANTKKWSLKKQQLLEEYMASKTSNSECFQSFLPFICKELEINECSSQEEMSDMFDNLGKMESFRTLGPLVKLMRWFSFWESWHFFLPGRHICNKTDSFARPGSRGWCVSRAKAFGSRVGCWPIIGQGGIEEVEVGPGFLELGTSPYYPHQLC